MSRLSAKLRSLEGGRVMFWCPGCDGAHQITVEDVPNRQGPIWGYNGNPDAPTFTPSILVQYNGTDAGQNRADGRLAPPAICHSFVTNGHIQFLGDCTHALAARPSKCPTSTRIETMTMLRPFRLQVLDNLVLLIRSIKPANGYQNDLSEEEKVVIGRLFVGDDEPTTMVAINEPPMAIEQNPAAPQNPNRFGEWDILIQGWAPNGDIHPSENAYILAADVCRALALEKQKPSGQPGTGRGPDFLGFADKILEMRIGAPVVRPPDETSALACFYILLTLKISEDMTKPFG